MLGQTHVTNARMASTPEHGDTYRRGEDIEVAVRFSDEVQVNAVDLDSTGITVAPGAMSESGEPNGILGSGSVVHVQNGDEYPVNITYGALIDQANHKVDGRA